jgi:uncharacterized protein (DUF362 family)
VGLKPNYVVSRTADGGATTHPEILEGIIVYLNQHGIDDITIMEGAWVGDSTKRAFKVCGAQDLQNRYGVKLIDLKSDPVKNIEGIDICKSALECGYLINLPVLKGHCQTRMTCALKNMKGCIPDSEKRAFHAQGLFEPIGHLGALIKPDLTVVDGICGDLSFEEGGNPVQMDRLIAGYDSVTIDSYVCQLMGLDISDVPYIEIAEQYGAGSSKIADDTVIELNTPKEGGSIQAGTAAQRLKQYTNEDKACSACYGSLIFALHNSDRRTLQNISGKINIGQGFQGKKIDGLGIGDCCSGCSDYVKGCPPRAEKIIEKLKEL